MLYNLPLRMAPFKVEINTNYLTMKWVQYWKKVRNIIYHTCNIYIKRGVDSLGWIHRCLESSEEMEAPQWCWSHCRSNLCCNAGPAERREVDINGHVYLPQCSVSLCSCLSQFPLLFVCLCKTSAWICVCVFSVGEYLAILRQEHRLGVTELLLDIMRGSRVMTLGVCTAERHRAQGIRGGCTLHALYRG